MGKMTELERMEAVKYLNNFIKNSRNKKKAFDQLCNSISVEPSDEDANHAKEIISITKFIIEEKFLAKEECSYEGNLWTGFKKNGKIELIYKSNMN